MRIIVQLKPDTARQARSRSRSTRERALGWLPHPLTPLHPRSSGTTLDTFFVIEVTDPDEGDRLLEQLRRDPAVDAAYVKPDDEAPSM